MQEKKQQQEGLQQGGAMDRASLINAALKNFRIAVRAVQSHSQWVESQCGVSSAQLWAMWELLSSPGLKVSELSRIMSIHQSTASNLLDKLERKGLVKRERKGPDQRVVRLYLSQEGANIVNQTRVPPQGVLTDALSRLPDEVLTSLSRDMQLLVAQINVKDHKAAMEPIADDDDERTWR